MKRSLPWLMLALSAMGLPADRVWSQGANHEGGHTGDGIRCSSGKPDAAIIACTSIIDDKRESDENHLIALRNRAVYFSQQGELDHAIADFTAALKLSWDKDPTAKVYVNRGLLYFRKGDDASALADYNQAVVVDPQLASAYINRASILMKRGDDTSAISDLEQALRLDPKDADIYVSRGSVYAHRGDNPRALADFSKAIEMNPADAMAWRGRGFVYRAMGDDTRAASRRRGGASTGSNDEHGASWILD